MGRSTLKFWAFAALAATPTARADNPFLRLVSDINPGSASGAPVNLTRMGDTLFFSATEPAGGRELWRSDGTAGGTVRVADIAPGAVNSSPAYLAAVGDRLFFAASQLNGPSPEDALWTSDGTAAGTTLVKKTRPEGLAGSRIKTILPFNGQAIFVADSGINAWELYRSDGTPAGTAPVSPSHPELRGSGTLVLAATTSHVYFNGGTGTQGVWRTDGTDAGTVPLLSNPSAFFGQTTGDTALFSYDDGGGTSGRELWRTQGTPQTTQLVKDLVIGPGSGNPFAITAHKGQGYFFVQEAGHRTVWRSDGSEAGTTPVADLGDGPKSMSGSRLFSAANRLYAVVVPTGGGFELWSIDDAGGGATRLGFLGVPAPGNSTDIFSAVTIGDTLALLAPGDQFVSGASAYNLWLSDGTAAGTQKIATGTTPTGTFPELAQLGDRVFLAGDVGDGAGSELYEVTVPEPTGGLLLAGLAAVALAPRRPRRRR